MHVTSQHHNINDADEARCQWRCDQTTTSNAYLFVQGVQVLGPDSRVGVPSGPLAHGGGNGCRQCSRHQLHVIAERSNFVHDAVAVAPQVPHLAHGEVDVQLTHGQ